MDGFDLSTASAIYVGDTLCSAVYIGSNLIWDGGTPPTPVQVYISLSTNTLSFNNTASRQTITVYSNVNWSIEVVGGDGWVFASPSNHTSTGDDETEVNIEVLANTGSARQATIQVSNGPITKEVTVSQQAGSSNPYYNWPVFPFANIEANGGSPQGAVTNPIGIMFVDNYNAFALKGTSGSSYIYQFNSWEYDIIYHDTDYNDSTTSRPRTDTIFKNEANNHFYVWNDGERDLVDLGTTNPTITP